MSTHAEKQVRTKSKAPDVSRQASGSASLDRDSRTTGTWPGMAVWRSGPALHVRGREPAVRRWFGGRAKREAAPESPGGLSRYRLPPGFRLTVSDPSDAAEREADRLASQVLASGPVDGVSEQARGKDQVQSQCEPCEERVRDEGALKGEVQGRGCASLVHQVLQEAGQPLASDLQARMEQRLGHDFGNVRIHVDSRAAESARAIGANAYTHGDHIVFARGRFQPGTADGLRLMGHELAHVVQQSRGDATGIQRDAASADYRAGYEAGLGGQERGGAPRDGDALVDYDEGYAKGHYELAQGPATGQADAAQRPSTTSSEGAPLPATEDAISGIHLEFMAPPLPSIQGTVFRFNFKRGPYLFVPQLRDRERAPKVAYYVAYRQDVRRNEYIIGPDKLSTFLSNVDAFRQIGDTAYADPGVIDYVVGFGDAVWDQQGDIVTQYMSWLGLHDFAEIHAALVREGKRIRDEQRTKQQQDAKATMATKVLPAVNAAMMAAAGARMLAGGVRTVPGTGGTKMGAPPAAPVYQRPPLVTIPAELRGSSAAAVAAKMGLPTPPAGYRWMKTPDARLAVARNPGTAAGAPKLNYNPASKAFEPEPAPAPKPAVVEARETVAAEFEPAAQDAVKAREAMAGVPEGKTGARAPDGTTTLSGWGRDVHSLDPVQRLSKQIGHPLEPSPLDAPGYRGSYNLSHAEKQLAVIKPNEPVGVSKVMCLDCQRFYQRLASARGRAQVVADPAGVRVFLPNGTVVIGPTAAQAAQAAIAAASSLAADQARSKAQP